MQRLIASVLLFPCVLQAEQQKSHHIIFEQVDIIHKLDGISNFGIDAEAIREALCVKRDNINIQYGNINSDGKTRTGHYLFQGKKVGLHALVARELVLSEELKKKGIDIKKIYNDSQQCPNYCAQEVAELKDCFKKAKAEFKKATFHMIDTIRDAQRLILKLMEESCRKRGIAHSPLLKWADVIGNEEAALNVTLLTIYEFDTFLTQLNMFLGDLIYNCPKAYKQFLNLRLK